MIEIAAMLVHYFYTSYAAMKEHHCISMYLSLCEEYASVHRTLCESLLSRCRGSSRVSLLVHHMYVMTTWTYGYGKYIEKTLYAFATLPLLIRKHRTRLVMHITDHMYTDASTTFSRLDLDRLTKQVLIEIKTECNRLTNPTMHTMDIIDYEYNSYHVNGIDNIYNVCKDTLQLIYHQLHRIYNTSTTYAHSHNLTRHLQESLKRYKHGIIASAAEPLFCIRSNLALSDSAMKGEYLLVRHMNRNGNNNNGLLPRDSREERERDQRLDHSILCDAHSLSLRLLSDPQTSWLRTLVYQIVNDGFRPIMRYIRKPAMQGSEWVETCVKEGPVIRRALLTHSDKWMTLNMLRLTLNRLYRVSMSNALLHVIETSYTPMREIFMDLIRTAMEVSKSIGNNLLVEGETSMDDIATLLVDCRYIPINMTTYITRGRYMHNNCNTMSKYKLEEALVQLCGRVTQSSEFNSELLGRCYEHSAIALTLAIECCNNNINLCIIHQLASALLEHCGDNYAMTVSPDVDIYDSSAAQYLDSILDTYHHWTNALTNIYCDAHTNSFPFEVAVMSLLALYHTMTPTPEHNDSAVNVIEEICSHISNESRGRCDVILFNSIVNMILCVCHHILCDERDKQELWQNVLTWTVLILQLRCIDCTTVRRYFHHPFGIDLYTSVPTDDQCMVPDSLVLEAETVWLRLIVLTYHNDTNPIGTLSADMQEMLEKAAEVEDRVIAAMNENIECMRGIALQCVRDGLNDVSNIAVEINCNNILCNKVLQYCPV